MHDGDKDNDNKFLVLLAARHCGLHTPQKLSRKMSKKEDLLDSMLGAKQERDKLNDDDDDLDDSAILLVMLAARHCRSH